MNKGAAVTAFYQSAASNMVGLPVYNTYLQVETTDFLAMNEEMLGVVVTPWCMNILLIPAVTKHDNIHCLGAKFRHTLPSGQYEFIRAYDETLGDYATCSVFSPMFEFSSQDVAIETANQVLASLFDEDNQAPSERQLAHEHYQARREAISNADEPVGSPLDEADTDETPTLEQSQQLAQEKPQALSRRAFLTGSFRRSEDSRP